MDLRTHFNIQLRLRMHGICLQCLMHFHYVVLNYKDRFFITFSLLCIFYNVRSLKTANITNYAFLREMLVCFTYVLSVGWRSVLT